MGSRPRPSPVQARCRDSVAVFSESCGRWTPTPTVPRTAVCPLSGQPVLPPAPDQSSREASEVSGLMKVWPSASRWTASTASSPTWDAASTHSRSESVRDTVELSQHSATGTPGFEEARQRMGLAPLHRSRVVVGGEADLHRHPVAGKTLEEVSILDRGAPVADAVHTRARPPLARRTRRGRPRRRGRSDRGVPCARPRRSCGTAAAGCRARVRRCRSPRPRCARAGAGPRPGPGGPGSWRCGGRAVAWR